MFELSHDFRERRLNIGDRALGIVRPLPLQAPVMLQEFFPVKLCDRVLRADWPRIGNEAWHAGSSGSVQLADGALSVAPPQNECQDSVRPSGWRFHAATSPPTHPTAIPPMISPTQRSAGRNRIEDMFIADASGARYRPRRARKAPPSALKATSAPMPPWRTPSITNGPRI